MSFENINISTLESFREEIRKIAEDEKDGTRKTAHFFDVLNNGDEFNSKELNEEDKKLYEKMLYFNSLSDSELKEKSEVIKKDIENFKAQYKPSVLGNKSRKLFSGYLSNMFNIIIMKIFLLLDKEEK